MSCQYIIKRKLRDCLGGLPKWLQNLIKSIGKGASGEVAKIALGYILKTQRKYLEASKANVFDEMSAIAKGVVAKYQTLNQMLKMAMRQT